MTVSDKRLRTLVAEYIQAIEDRQRADMAVQRCRERIENALADDSQSLGMPYADYLASDHWQAVRRLALDAADYRCQVCGTRRSKLNVHHNNYERLGHERPSDVVVLCESCHQFHHQGRVLDAELDYLWQVR